MGDYQHAGGDGRLAAALSACRGAFVAVTLFSMTISLLMLTVPLYMLHISDHVLPSRSTETLLALSAIAILALLVYGVLEATRAHVLQGIGTWLDKRLGAALLESSVQLAVRAGGTSSVQGLRDLATFRGFLTSPGIFPFLDSPWTPLFVGVIFLLHPTLGWLALGSAAILLVLAVAHELITRSPLRRASNESIRVLATAEAAMRNAEAIEAMGMLPHLVARWSYDNAQVLAVQSRAGTLTGYVSAASKFVRLALQVAMLGVGAYLALKGEITPGVMISCSILVTRALAPVEQAIGSGRAMAAAYNAYRRLVWQLRATPPRGSAMALPAPAGRLALENVMYAHPGSREPLLRGVSESLAPGESLGLIGSSGSGKTTLARLIVGNQRPNVGHVRLDDADVADWNADDRGQYVGYLPQDVELFAGTVRDNIARMSDGPNEAVIAAAQLAGVHELILRLPKGYETEIGASGVNLSGGERQRIALARALYGGPSLVVLDEPNASLDAAGEEALVSVLDRLREQRITCIIIAHRPNVLRKVDRIMMLSDGQVRMSGPRDEILPRLWGPELAAAAHAPEAIAKVNHA